MKQYSITDAKTVTYTFHLGIKKEIAEFMEVGMEDKSRSTLWGVTHKPSLGRQMVFLMAVDKGGAGEKGLSEQKEQLGYKMEVISSLYSMQNSAHRD